MSLFVPDPTPWRVLELRRYTLNPGTRDDFAADFDRWYPEAFLQCGMLPVAQFLDRDSPDGFVWARAFRSAAARGLANASFYYGPVWAETRDAMNARIADHTDVLLLQPMEGTSLACASPDPRRAPDASRGFGVLQVLAPTPESREAVSREAALAFAAYAREDGIRTVGAFTSFDGPDTFPQLPHRMDGPYLAWLGIARDEAALARVAAAAGGLASRLAEGGSLRQPAEWWSLAPTARSRAGWTGD